VDVAARQREAVGLADGGAGLDPDGEVEVAHEPADDRDLLGVLLAEPGRVGRHHVEQLRDDRRDPVEVGDAAVRALEVRGEPRDADGGGEAVGVDLLDRRREEQVGARLRGELGVAGLVAGVAGEVRGLVELGRVDEQRHHDDVAGGAGGADEAEVALVQRAHGRYEPDRALRAAGVAQRGAQVGDGADGPHPRTSPPRLARARVASASAS
jgi:hypothetical protein